ncbi:hypothetical protein D9M70_481340 [compost metagenome]
MPEFRAALHVRISRCDVFSLIPLGVPVNQIQVQTHSARISAISKLGEARKRLLHCITNAGRRLKNLQRDVCQFVTVLCHDKPIGLTPIGTVLAHVLRRSSVPISDFIEQASLIFRSLFL